MQPIPASESAPAASADAAPSIIEHTALSTDRPNPKQSRWRRLSKWLATLAVAFVALLIYAKAIAPEAKAILFVHVTNAAGVPITSGNVTVDDVPSGKPDQNLSVKIGTVRVGFALPGWSAESLSATLGNGASVRVELVARPLPARITVTTNPSGATIVIGGRSQGRTPLTLDLAPQAYTVIATRDGHLSKTVELTLAPGEARTLTMDLALVAPAPPPAPVAPSFSGAPFERGVASSSVPLSSSPSRGSSIIAIIPPDTEIAVLGRVDAEDSWLQVRTSGRTGFVSATGAIELWDAWARRHTVTGVLDEVTPGLRAVVRGTAYALNGVKQPDHGSASGLATMQDALARQLRGSTVICTPQTTTRFDCKTSSGNDVGEYYVLNGAAVPGDGAPGYYFESQQGARSRKKGIWAE